jgi:hypothetical protein
MAKVARKIQEPETGIALDLGGDEFAGLVAASVIKKKMTVQDRSGVESNTASSRRKSSGRTGASLKTGMTTAMDGLECKAIPRCKSDSHGIRCPVVFQMGVR